MRAALINEVTNIVENVIIIGPGYQAPDGYYLVETDYGNIGDKYEDGEFIPQETQD